MIETILRERIGLDAGTIGKGKLHDDVKRRMEACGIKDMHAYEMHLLSSHDEMEKLISIVTIPETWFFRAYDSFIFLEEFIRAEWMPQAASYQRPLRVLSIPSSTGEEPYSIAMTLLRCGLSPASFHIDAADINTANLASARKGVYSKNSFRSELQWFKDIYFSQMPDGRHFQLDKSVLDCVSFHHWNLLELLPPAPGSEDLYDVVFCRNLLIYFDQQGQKKALDILSAFLKENGLLFLGHAESTSILFGYCFMPVDAKGSFAFRKLKPQNMPQQWDPTDTQKLLKVFRSRPAASAPKPKSAIMSAARPCIPIAPSQPAPKAAVQPAAKTVPPPEPDPKKESDLDKARHLADRGHLKEAAELCKVHIDKNRLDPEGYFLLGVILLSLKRGSEAENFLNKALFLKPDHSDALLRLAVLKEGRGDKRGADLCRRRAGRTEGAANAV